MNKKVVSIILLGLFLFVFAINFVSSMSLYEGISEVGKSISQLITPIVQFLLGDVSEGLFLTKILIFVIIIVLVWIALEKITIFDNYKIIKKVLVFSVAVLAMKGIGTSQLIDAILTPYTAMGVAISAGLPFLIYFGIINLGLGDQPSIVRRISWIFFGVIFFGLLASKIGGVGNLLIPSTWGFYWIYMMTSFIALAMAFLDGTIKGFFIKVEAKKLENINTLKLLAKLKSQKQEYDNARDLLTEKEYNRLIKNLQRQAKSYGIKRFI